MRQVIGCFAPRALDGDGGATLVAFRTGQPIEAVLPAIQALLETGTAAPLV